MTHVGSIWPKEDAADVFSVLLIDEIFEPESANIIAYDAAFGFTRPRKIHLHFGICTGQTNSVIKIWFVSFMADNSELREDLVYELGLSEERAISCTEEYEPTIYSWGGVLQVMEGGTAKLRLMGPSSNPVYPVIRK